MARARGEIEDARRIFSIFSEISEESKVMAFVYLSALRDKEIADGRSRSQEEENAVCVS